jgi:hypothetical protein
MLTLLAPARVAMKINAVSLKHALQGENRTHQVPFECLFLIADTQHTQISVSRLPSRGKRLIH